VAEAKEPDAIKNSFLRGDFFTSTRARERGFSTGLKSQRCVVITRRGTQCRQPCWPSADRCLLHHTEEQRRAILDELIAAEDLRSSPDKKQAGVRNSEFTGNTDPNSEFPRAADALSASRQKGSVRQVNETKDVRQALRVSGSAPCQNSVSKTTEKVGIFAGGNR
jgi:hypothetical protein